MFMKPLIGITNYYVDSNELGELEDRPRGITGQDMAMCTMDYVRAVKQAGGIPIMLSHLTDEDYITNITRKCDGFLFSGGGDVDPLLYGATPAEKCGQVVPERDRFEMALIKEVINHNKPLLGICRGLQLINTYYQGTLYQDLSECDQSLEHHKALNYPKWKPVHEVELETGSHLANIFNKSKIMTNSFHHQIIKEVGKNLQVTAKTQDGIVEALEDKQKDFLLGVQWHPEMMFEEVEEQIKLFKYFVEQAKN